MSIFLLTFRSLKWQIFDTFLKWRSWYISEASILAIFLSQVTHCLPGVQNRRQWPGCQMTSDYSFKRSQQDFYNKKGGSSPLVMEAWKGRPSLRICIWEFCNYQPQRAQDSWINNKNVWQQKNEVPIQQMFGEEPGGYVRVGPLVCTLSTRSSVTSLPMCLKGTYPTERWKLISLKTNGENQKNRFVWKKTKPLVKHQNLGVHFSVQVWV